MLSVAPQLAWPQVHISSILPPMPSQCALQYLDLLSATLQVQAALPHFFA
jgi:hypothetical protein